MNESLRNRIFSITSEEEFNDTAIEVFRYQALENPVYKLFISGLGIDADSVESVNQIPFLPIEFFKNHRIISGPDNHALFFESSGTTGPESSRHYITDTQIYNESFLSGFRYFFGDPQNWMFAALLPSYIERGNSSLVYMCDHLIRMSSDRRSKFWLKDTKEMIDTLRHVSGEGKSAMLIGVSYALLDLAEKHPADLSAVTVVETGGMKGKRKEITREEMHEILKAGLNVEVVHSEYGMTELLSQAWSHGSGLFRCPPWMKICLREINDPLSIIYNYGVTGGINIIDLANINSCAFIASSDLGKLHPGGYFEVLGRFDNSDIRGCNLLIG